MNAQTGEGEYEPGICPVIRLIGSYGQQCRLEGWPIGLPLPRAVNKKHAVRPHKRIGLRRKTRILICVSWPHWLVEMM